jgi:hypothetical protein
MAETNEEEAWTLLEGKIGKMPKKKKKIRKKKWSRSWSPLLRAYRALEEMLHNDEW